jgi:hypothetical protein
MIGGAIRCLVLVAAMLPGLASAQGEIVITQAKAVAGGVTPGDPPGMPVVLTVSGTYILGSNLAADPGLDAIVAATSDITIDLNGFRISGGPAGGSNNGRLGIWGKGDRLTVRNGTITGFRFDGIYAIERLYLIVEDMRLINNGRNGILATRADFARLMDNTIATNGNTGVACGDSCHVEGNVISSNGGFGIEVESGTILGNSIFNNTGYGIYTINDFKVGFGNNVLIENHTSSAVQTWGYLLALQPNSCPPVSPC